MMNLVNARKAMKKTQQEMADYLGISRQAYSNYETGKREPDYETLLKLGEYLDCSIDYLLGKKSDPSPKAEISDDDIRFALFGGAKVTDAQFEEVKRFARYIAENNIKPRDLLFQSGRGCRCACCAHSVAGNRQSIRSGGQYRRYWA